MSAKSSNNPPPANSMASTDEIPAALEKIVKLVTSELPPFAPANASHEKNRLPVLFPGGIVLRARV